MPKSCFFAAAPMPSAGVFNFALYSLRVTAPGCARAKPKLETKAMKLPRRQFLHLAAGAGALPRLAQIAWAQTYPSRPVRIIVGFPAGSATDIVARLIGQSLSERLGQQVLVENRPGTGSNIAAAEVVRATANGYTPQRSTKG